MIDYLSIHFNPSVSHSPFTGLPRFACAVRPSDSRGYVVIRWVDALAVPLSVGVVDCHSPASRCLWASNDSNPLNFCATLQSVDSTATQYQSNSLSDELATRTTELSW
jgi:hypothetical protein